MQLTKQQKLEAMAFRFYQNGEWTPKAGDYYTSTRADLELYQVVDVKDGQVTTQYVDGGEGISEWPENEFTTDGFGIMRVFVPGFILNQAASEVAI